MADLPPLHADTVNLGPGERALSGVLGGALVLWGLDRFTPRSIAISLAGVCLLHRAVTGYCAANAALGIHQPPLLEGEDEVDAAGMESFPASDPPSWSGAAAGEPHREG